MDPRLESLAKTRREFFTTCAGGLGGAALTAMLAEDGAFAAGEAKRVATADVNPLAPKRGDFPAKAKACIFIFMAGAPSQLDLFDHKPKLKELDGQKLPESLVKNMRFAFLQKDTATLLGSRREFRRHGESGMWFSDLLPNLATCADDICMIKTMQSDQFNHHPGQLLMQTGTAMWGFPSAGSWLSYGLGTENQNLPGYVVLTAGRGSSGGATLWQSGFLPSIHEGVRFRTQGDPILNLANPKGLPDSLQRKGLDVLGRLNQKRFDQVHDPEIASRISNYELAFRMQTSAPELIDLSGETQATLDMYGVGRKDADVKAGRGGGPGQYNLFARNCLLARRMIERGVRFVNIIHASWDHHSNLDNELTYNAGMADQPIAALIRDLKQRGLLEDTMVVWGSEFGRTPLGENRNGNNNNVTGRDHHPYAFSMFLAGGGIRGGQVYGETDEIGWGVTKDPVHPNDLHATMLHCFGLDHLRHTHRFQGRDFRLTDVAGNVIDRWLA
ncbi:MAG: DUF1501 domain-containing protein [Planctomycetaceae bacterium]|nr:DUF1501 domain-containing protein [Planctomycetaceae bacterium]